MNSSRFEYLIVLACVVIPTILLTFHPRSEMRGRVTYALIAITLSAIPFVLWDIYATTRGHWSFNETYVMGLNISVLPIEEILFFLAVPYSCLYLWNVIRDFESWSTLKNKLLNLHK